MKKLFISLFLTALTYSCTTENSDSKQDGQDLIKLKNELRRLEKENAEKDALIDQSLGIFSEIQENVAKIQHKENEIRLISEKGVENGTQKEWLLQELKNIQFLREENSRKIKLLDEQLEGREALIGQLYQMLESLHEKLVAQDALIAELQNSLEHQDADYSKLFDAYVEQGNLAENANKELSKAYYVYGTLDELKKNNIVVQSKGFIGIGKKSALRDGFNEDYFTPINKFEKKKIQIIGNKITMISDHPSTSYEIISQGNTKIIKILNAYEFWKISKYLVVIVD